MLDRSQKRVLLIAAINGAMLLVPLMVSILSPQLSIAPPYTKDDYSGYARANEKSGNDDVAKTNWQRIVDRTLDDPIALYTFVLAIFTGVLGIVAIVQIRFLIRADKTTRIAAEAAGVSADAASKTVKTMEDTAVKQLRAYVPY